MVIMNVYFERHDQFIFVNFSVKLFTYACL